MLIVAETAGARFSAFDITEDGTLAGRRVWAEVPGYAPDGCALDAAGGLWFADARGQRVARVLLGGEVTDVIPTGTGTWACALGGEDGRTLFITTGPGPAQELCAGKAAGAILTTRVETPHAGWP
jgi:sugar lactone lactonase YvrE